MAKNNESTEKYWIGFDLGGTKMRAVLYDRNFKPLSKKRKGTKPFDGQDAGLARIRETIDTVLEEADVSASALAGIGVGAPGPLDPCSGILHDLPNLGWKNVKLKADLESAFKCGAVVINDVDAGVYGEYRYGSAKGANCVLGIFPGTGIGGGCVYRGEIIRGETMSCMEIGHIPVVPEGQLCGCGNRGCLETVASRMAIASAVAAAAYRGAAPTILESAGTDVSKIRSGLLRTAIEAGDISVERIVRNAARYLGVGLATAVNLLLPDRIILGGGLVESMPKLYVEEVSAALEQHVMPSFRNAYKLNESSLGDDATVLGAAAWAAHALPARK